MVSTNNSLLLLSPLSFLFRSILHDPNAFNDAMEYQPQAERYLKDGKLNPDVRDPGCAAFGFGRRWVDTTYSPTSILMVHLPYYLSLQIPKRQLVIHISCLLAVYDIKPPVDNQGSVIELKPKFTSG